jgi:tripartite-type tricarboxylate transporter receptor subunit TctC
MNTRRQVLQAALSASSLLAAGPLLAQGIGSAGAPARFVVPYTAGGPTDVLARIVAQRLEERWKQPVLVDYQPGAGTIIGVSAVARAAPDGLTFGVVNSAFPINSIIKKTPYDTFKDLTGITQLVDVPLALVANAATPYNTVAELVAYARRNPGKLSFASPGAGGTSHLAGELLNRVAGIDLLHVAYRGSAPAQTDVIGGQVPLMIDPLLSVLPFVKAGKLKIIAVLSPKRVPGAEQYPVVAETYPGFEVSTFLGLIAPAATPHATVAKIAADVAAVMADPRDAQRIAALGMYPNTNGPEAFNKLLHHEVAKWGKVIREANLKLD